MSTVTIRRARGLSTAETINMRTTAGSLMNMRRGFSVAAAHSDITTSPHTVHDAFNVSSVVDAGQGSTSPYFINALNGATYTITLGVSGEVNSEHTPGWLATTNTAYWTVMSHSCNSGAGADKSWFSSFVNGNLA
jgi:hypothetical protein